MELPLGRRYGLSPRSDSEHYEMENIMTATITAPANVTATTAAAADIAATRIMEVIGAGSAASAAAITKVFGSAATMAALRLAHRAASELSGATKSRGGARADVIAVVAGVRDSGAPIVADTFVVAARARLDANAADKARAKAAKAERTDSKRALADRMNDSSASEDARAAALSVLVGMDDEDNAADRAAAIERVNARVTALVSAARAAGINAKEFAAMAAAAYAAPGI